MLTLPDFRQKNILLCFSSSGQKISFRNDNVLVTDKEGETVLQSTCHRIFSLWVIGHVSITSVLLEKSRKFGFSVYILSTSFRTIGLVNCITEGNFLLRRRQYNYKGLDIPILLISNKIQNQRILLMSLRRKSLTLTEAIAQLDSYREKCLAIIDEKTLLGLEGSASRVFFSQWFFDLPWKGRKPRLKTDILNVVLDIGYTYLFNFIDCMLNLYGFDVYEGVYHKNFYQRKSLVCDLVEPFRCIIDHKVRIAYNLGQIKQEHFRLNDSRYFLSIEYNKEYAKLLMAPILDYKVEIFNYVQNYYRCFMRQREIDLYPVFYINQ
jgi:CRISPR-associated protein Cas1